MNNVRSYTDKQLTTRAFSLDSFAYIPSGYWLLGVQSNEDAYNEFDDKFYLFKGNRFIMVLSGTTNAGASAIMNYKKFNPKGVAVLKTNEWYYNCWQAGLHKGKMRALKQIAPMKFYRDWNKNRRIEETGKLREGIIGCEFHTATYTDNMNFVRKLIGGWSAVCQVANSTKDYYKVLALVGTNKVSYCLLKEF